MAEAAAHWREEGKPSDLLLHSGKPLAEAADILDRRRPDLQPEMVNYIESSLRTRKAARRRRRIVISAVAALFFVVVTGFGAYSYSQWQKTQQALDDEIQAEEGTHMARDLSDGVIQSLVRNNTRLDMNRLGDAEKKGLRDLLDYARRNPRQIVPESSNTEKARFIRAEENFRIAHYELLLGESSDAEEHFRRSIKLFEKLADEFPAVAVYRVQAARGYFNLGHLLNDKPKEAETAYHQAILLHEKLAVDFPAKPGYRQDLAEELSDLGALLSQIEPPRLAEAATYYQRAIDVEQKLTVEFPTDVDLQIKLAAILGNLGNAVRDQGQVEASVSWYAKVIALLDPIVAKDRRAATAQRYLRNAYWDRANALGQLGQFAKAVSDWQHALDLDDGPDRDSIRLFQATVRAKKNSSPRERTLQVRRPFFMRRHGPTPRRRPRR